MTETLIISNTQPVEFPSLELLRAVVSEIINGIEAADEVCLESPDAWRRVDGCWFRPAGTHYPSLSLMRFASDSQAPSWVVHYCDPARELYLAVSEVSGTPIDGILCGAPARIYSRCLVSDEVALSVAESFFKKRTVPFDAGWVDPSRVFAE